jgi:tetratricopeptide (TPR) repeat protein
MRIAAGILMILSMFGSFPWIAALGFHGYDMLFPLVLIVMFIAGMGGFAALRRKYYRLVFVGAICSLLLLPIFGAPALILLLERKSEFEEKEEEKKKADTYYKRGDVYYDMGPFGQVIVDLSKAIELDPNSASAYYNRGLAYHEKGEVTEAVSDLEKCIGLSSDGELTKAAQQALSEIKNSHREG